MGRGNQFARRSHNNDGDQTDDEDRTEINNQISDAEKQRRAELEKLSMLSELKHLEKRWTKKGRGYIAEPKDDEDIPDEKINWYEKFALCVTREYDHANEYVCKSSLQVNSPHLKELLRDVIGNYPGQSFHTKNVTIDFEPECLYHFRSELLEEGRSKFEPGSEGESHLKILMTFINEHFVDTIAESGNLQEQKLMAYDLLWTIFKPDTLVYTQTLSQPRVYKLTSYGYVSYPCPGLKLSCGYVDFDGNSFGTRNTDLLIPLFKGSEPITSLNVSPLHFHDSKDMIVKTLIERGRRWEAHAGQKFCEYTGVALDTTKCRNRYNISGRIMIDCRTFHRIRGNDAFSVSEFPKTTAEKRKQGLKSNDFELVPDQGRSFQALTDHQALLASPIVRGFSFTEKQFLEFFIGNVSPIQWNDGCFEQLVLPAAQKETVQALVAEHTRHATDPHSAAFDDIVKGKGRGLILVLHGPPGVGKTLTAECVAEFSHRPLYIVSSGDLGTQSETLDTRLSQILDLASTWKAVLLVDEADVFLESRSLHDLERNSLVSIFLRTLEYYSGILFMTTNRVQTFDDAFKSRIHVPLKYENLPHSSRVMIWKNFLAKVEGGVDVDEEGYQILGDSLLNGRQIKNVIRTAKSLASYKKRKLDHEQLRQVMDIQMAFEAELDNDKDSDSGIEIVKR